MPEFLTLSHDHRLLPLAAHLEREGHKSPVVVDKPWYDGCWEGLLDRLLPAEADKDEAVWKAVVLRTRQAGVPVLTTSWQWAQRFEGYPLVYGTLRGEGRLGSELVGFWWDGTAPRLPHLLVEDRGLWPGGKGPQELAGATLVATDLPASWWEALAPVTERLREEAFRGWVRAQLRSEGDDAREVHLAGWCTGWRPGQMHAAVAALPRGGFASLLSGESEGARWAAGCATAVAVSQPPYPARTARAPARGEIALEGAKELAEAGLLWGHDIQAGEAGGWETAGTDGLVGWATGAGRSMWLARQRALQVAGAIGRQLPEAQVRGDVGARVPEFVGMLEARGVAVGGGVVV